MNFTGKSKSICDFFTVEAIREGAVLQYQYTKACPHFKPVIQCF